MKTKSLAVIIPVYNEASALENHLSVIIDIFKNDGVDAHIMLVNDGSADDTWQVIESLSKQYTCVSGIGFSRNFGKEMALSAGVDAIDADLYLFMDSDLQHPPSCVRGMLDEMEATGADILEGVKSSRGKESFKYRLVAKNFYKMLRYMTKLDLDNSSDFKIMTREVIDSIRKFEESNVFFRGVVQWVGFNVVQYPFEVEERQEGTSSFSVFRLMTLALNAILSYTSKPLYLTIIIGFLFFAFAAVLGVQTLYNFFTGIAVDGFSTVILLILILGSMLMTSLGIIGIYISRIYDEVKRRPRYVIKDKVGEGAGR